MVEVENGRAALRHAWADVRNPISHLKNPIAHLIYRWSWLENAWASLRCAWADVRNPISPLKNPIAHLIYRWSWLENAWASLRCAWAEAIAREGRRRIAPPFPCYLLINPNQSFIQLNRKRLKLLRSPGELTGGRRNREKRRKGLHLDGIAVELQNPQPAIAAVAMPAAA